MILQQIGREEDQEGQRIGARRSEKRSKEAGIEFEWGYYRPNLQILAISYAVALDKD